jgi:hypothetical protein
MWRGLALVKSVLLRALAGVAFAACGSSTNPTHAAPRYVVTERPIDLAIRSTSLCVAVDPADPHGAWWWQPGRSGCPSRSTGPDVFHADEAAVTSPSGQDRIEVRFRVQLHHRPGSPEPAFLDVALRIEGGEMTVPATGAQTPIIRRDTLQIPESWR